MSEPVKDWLRTKRVMLWGPGGWDLTDEKDVVKAAEWFTAELAEFGDHIFYGYGADLYDYFGKTRLVVPPNPLTRTTPPAGVSANPLQENS